MNTSSTPKVRYDYADADGSDKTIRPMKLVYPGSATWTYDYGGSINDAASRIGSIREPGGSGTQAVVSYERLGLATPVIVKYDQPGVTYTLVGTSLANDPDTGDIYKGLDPVCGSACG